MAPGILSDSSLAYEHAIEAPKSTDKLSSQVKEWPTLLTNKLAWDGAGYAVDEQYTYHLTNEDKNDIDNALKQFGSMSKDAMLLTESNA
ncbi:hypothetical protein MMC12_004915 [Toensbergia leucococca]|nr:hypothetical protein [Toensbergia leucococca]